MISSSYLYSTLLLFILCLLTDQILSNRIILEEDQNIAPLIFSSTETELYQKYIVALNHVSNDPNFSELEDDSIHAQSSSEVLKTHMLWLEEVLRQPNSESRLLHTYELENFAGYSGEFSDETLAKIRAQKDVLFVEPDQMVWVGDSDIDLIKSMISSRGLSRKSRLFTDYGMPSYRHFDALSSCASLGPNFESKSSSSDNFIKQTDAPWGISRLSSKFLPKDGHYIYPKSAGSGVDVYVIDTGINIAHSDFGNRAKWGVTVPQFDMDIDGNGHGTHCAGIIAGQTFGVAKNASVIAVKVLKTNGFGTNSDVIKGVEWVMNQHRVQSRRGRRSIVNMSLGGGKSLALERAVNSCVENGIHFAVAAGNDNANACNFSPASSDRVITVGASTPSDRMAPFSNNGPCVDIFAPGLDIISAWTGSKHAVKTISGTSMASPHVAGVLALYLAEKSYEPSVLKEILIQSALSDVISSLPPKTSNKLLNSRSLLKSMEKKTI